MKNAVEIAKVALQKAEAALGGKAQSYGFTYDSPQWKVDAGGLLSPELQAAEIINAALAEMPETAPWAADHEERYTEWLAAVELLEQFAEKNEIKQYTDL